MNDYQASITCPVSGECAYRAITEEMSDWWTSMSGQFLEIGDCAKTDFGGESYWSFEARVLNEFARIELLCHDANHIHEGQPAEIKEEWLGSTLIFDITEKNGETDIKFTHEGLAPSLLCFDVCKIGWDHYFLGELNNYLTKKGIGP